MTAFSDAFERADGPLGNDWSIKAGAFSITGGRVICTNSGRALVAQAFGSGRHQATLDAWTVNAGGVGFLLAVKCNSDFSAGYFCYIGESGGVYTLYLAKGNPNAPTSLASAIISSVNAASVLFSLVWEGGNLSATFDGSAILTASDSDYAAGTYTGFLMARGDILINAFSFSDEPAQSMEVTPDPLWIGGGRVLMTAVGLGTEWTAGIPGGTTFTCDHGDIDGQYVVDGTHAQFYLTPAEYVGPITFTESTYDLEDTINTTVDPTAGGPVGECLLTEDGAGLVNATAAHTSGDLLTTDSLIVHGELSEPDLVITQAIRDLWYAEFRTDIDPPSGSTGESVLNQLLMWLSGGYLPTMATPAPPAQTTLKEDTAALAASFSNLTTGGTWTLHDLLENLGGTPLLNHQDLLTAIQAVSPSNLSDVLDAIAAVRGANQPDLAVVVDLIQQLSTIAGYNLSDVLDAIAAIPSADLSGVNAKLTAIQPSELVTLSSLGTSLATVASTVDSLVLAVQAIAEALDALRALVGQNTGAPVWPGADNVTLGTPVALTNNLHIIAPMDGVIVNVTTPPSRSGLYEVGGAMLDYGQGRMTFETDAGDLEPWQYTGFRTAIYTPKTMKRAAGARFQVLAGAGGTVTPWVVSA